MKRKTLLRGVLLALLICLLLCPAAVADEFDGSRNGSITLNLTDGKGNDVTERFHGKTVAGTLRILDWNGGSVGSANSSDIPTGASERFAKPSNAQAAGKLASVSAKTGDGIVLYAAGLAGAAAAAGAVALLARKKRDADK